MTPDRELLRLASRAVGIGPVLGYEATGLLIGLGKYLQIWNPLTDNGEALKVATYLRLTVQQRDDHVKVGWPGCVEWIGEDLTATDELSRLKATRRAIVRAAAVLGAGM